MFSGYTICINDFVVNSLFMTPTLWRGCCVVITHKAALLFGTLIETA